MGLISRVSSRTYRVELTMSNIPKIIPNHPKSNLQNAILNVAGNNFYNQIKHKLRGGQVFIKEAGNMQTNLHADYIICMSVPVLNREDLELQMKGRLNEDNA